MNIVNKILVCAAVIAGSQSVGATVVPADDVFVLYTPESPTFTMRQSYGGMYGMAAISLISPKEVTLNMDSEETVKLYYGETLIGEAGTKMTDGSGIANMSVSLMADDGLLEWETPNIWVIMFDDSRPQSMREVGDYSVVIPEGLFLYKEDSLGEKVLNYSLVAQIPDSFSHTVVPENGTEFTTSEPLEQITLTISGTARYVDVEGPVGALYDPEGNRVECTTYKPKVSGTKLTWTIEPAAADFVWSTGEYKFIIPAKSIYVNTSSDYAMAGNYPPQDIEMTYLVVAGKSKIPFESTFTYEVPSQPEFSYTTSYMYEVNNGQGMGAVVLSAP
ncbi:MAG: hypothetical protein K2M03_08845 [Muribaculaceae bacterium]|nr:hypothetical protein [Muribaculaceae bacterium]